MSMIKHFEDYEIYENERLTNENKKLKKDLLRLREFVDKVPTILQTSQGYSTFDAIAELKAELKQLKEERR